MTVISVREFPKMTTSDVIVNDAVKVSFLSNAMSSMTEIFTHCTAPSMDPSAKLRVNSPGRKSALAMAEATKQTWMLYKFEPCIKRSPCELSLMLSKAVKRLPMVVPVVPPDSSAHTCTVSVSGTVSAAGTDTVTVEGGKGHYAKACMVRYYANY